jgi:hypothetical protein
MSDKVSDEIANQHLPYEINQLRGTFNQLMQIERAVFDERDVSRLIVRNALIESFCVHARSLIDFFANRRTKPTDVIAGDFGAFPASLEPENKPLQFIRTKLNKQIFHLTQDRTIIEAEQFDAQSDGIAVLRLIEPEIERFNALRPLKCTIPPLNAPNLQSRTTTTSPTKSMQIVEFKPAT